MKIGFDAKRAFYNKSGLGNYSRSAIDMLCNFFPGNQYFLFTPKTNNAIEIPRYKNMQDISPSGYFGKKFSSFWRTYGVSSLLKNNNFDIFHGLSNELPTGIAKTNTKAIVTIHDLIFVRYPELYKPIDRFIYRQKFAGACKAADTVIAISQQTKRDIIEFFGIDEKKIKVVYQICNPIFYQQQTSEKKLMVASKYNLPKDYILMVSTIEERKNALTVIKAVHRAKIDMPVVLVGRPTPYLDKIKLYCKENKIENKVQYITNIDFVDLPAIYQMANLLAYPSIFEGFGLPVLEALHSGVPVITTKGGCFAEAGGEHSVYVNPTDVDELQHEIVKVLSDTNLRRNMIENGLIHAQKFLPEKVANNLMDVYQLTIDN